MKTINKALILLLNEEYDRINEEKEEFGKENFSKFLYGGRHYERLVEKQLEIRKIIKELENNIELPPPNDGEIVQKAG